MNTFTNKIIEERQIKKPKLVLGADGSTSKCIVAGMILEADEEVDLRQFQNTNTLVKIEYFC